MLEMVDRVDANQLADMARPFIPPMRQSYRLCRALIGSSNKLLIFYYSCLNNPFKIRLISFNYLTGHLLDTGKSMDEYVAS
jgi:hypothetical protein